MLNHYSSYSNPYKPPAFTGFVNTLPNMYAYNNTNFANHLKVKALFDNALAKLPEYMYELKGISTIADYAPFIFNGPKKMPDGTIRETLPFITIPEKPIILVNPKFDWENVEKRVADNYSNGNLAYNNPIGLILHEAGHYLHFKANMNKYKAAGEELPFGQEAKYIQQNVSKLAATDYGEFIAEVFAMHKLGHTVDEKIKKIYKDWAYYGPNIFGR